MDIKDILSSDGTKAYISGSFAETTPIETIPKPIWIYTNVATNIVYADNKPIAEILFYIVNYYTSTPDDLRTIVKAKQNELIQNGYTCGGIFDSSNVWSQFGLSFECQLLKKY